MSWIISTFSAAKEMEEQAESAGVLFTGCYLQVVQMSTPSLCVCTMSRVNLKRHATFV